MIIAVHPDNAWKYCDDSGILVFNQGQLLNALTDHPDEEVLIEPETPGHLLLEDLCDIIKARFPEIALSIVRPPEPVFLPALVEKPMSQIIVQKESTPNFTILMIYTLLVGGFFFVLTMGAPQQLWYLKNLAAVLAIALFGYMVYALIYRRRLKVSDK